MSLFDLHLIWHCCQKIFGSFLLPFHMFLHLWRALLCWGRLCCCSLVIVVVGQLASCQGIGFGWTGILWISVQPKQFPWTKIAVQYWLWCSTLDSSACKTVKEHVNRATVLDIRSAEKDSWTTSWFQPVAPEDVLENNLTKFNASKT